jgi:hypothetical protein
MSNLIDREASTQRLRRLALGELMHEVYPHRAAHDLRADLLNLLGPQAAKRPVTKADEDAAIAALLPPRQPAIVGRTANWTKMAEDFARHRERAIAAVTSDA